MILSQCKRAQNEHFLSFSMIDLEQSRSGEKIEK